MKKELNDKSLEKVTGGNAPSLPATTLGPSCYDSPEISPSIQYKNDSEWSSDRPTDAGDYKVKISVD